MIAIPQEEYVQLTAVQNVRQPLTQQMYNLEKQHIEESQVKDPYSKLILQSNTLDEMKNLKDQMRNYIRISTPKPYINRAQALYSSVEPFLKFNERGEIYSKEGSMISNSRLEDLIQHAVRDRRRNMIPIGWNIFLDLLRERNIPKSILNRATLDEMEKVKTPAIMHDSRSVSRLPLPTRKSHSIEKIAPPLSRKHLKRTRTPSRRYPSSEFLKDF